MAYLLNDAADFVDEMTDGFVAAHRDVVRRVDGGVVRAGGTPPGQVAVVIGGGSGHYPAFAGLVGPGLAHGAAMGNVFASPSAHQIHTVARAAEAGAGVLLSYGNYAGDVLNFDLAQDRLIAEGIACRTVVVTDDVSSGARDETSLRRGVAGDLTVFRAAAWAAEQGRDLDAVWELADRANTRTRTLGVAFSGCTLPGADGPLFTVPPGRMALGMGIHGEPGIDETALAGADDIAELLVTRLLAEDVPGDRVAVIVNGLGSVKSEELYVLYHSVARRLSEASLTPVRPEVGEYATSFEMAGVSLTLMGLDEELERAWTAPSDAPGYVRAAARSVPDRVATVAADGGGADDHDIPPASDESRAAAALVAAAARDVAGSLDERAGELGSLDAVAGDGDHGLGMQRGSAAAAEAATRAVSHGAGLGTTLIAAGDAWSDRAGGTSGALWGAALWAAGSRLGDTDPVDPEAVAAAVTAGIDAVARAGGAQPGDKTMLDAMLPFAQRFTGHVRSGHDVAGSWQAASSDASTAAARTAELVARRGRARPHGDKSIGTPDPGATSFAIVVDVAGRAVTHAGAST